MPPNISEGKNLHLEISRWLEYKLPNSIQIEANPRNIKTLSICKVQENERNNI